MQNPEGPSESIGDFIPYIILAIVICVIGVFLVQIIATPGIFLVTLIKSVFDLRRGLCCVICIASSVLFFGFYLYSEFNFENKNFFRLLYILITFIPWALIIVYSSFIDPNNSITSDFKWLCNVPISSTVDFTMLMQASVAVFWGIFIVAFRFMTLPAFLIGNFIRYFGDFYLLDIDDFIIWSWPSFLTFLNFYLAIPLLGIKGKFRRYYYQYSTILGLITFLSLIVFYMYSPYSSLFHFHYTLPDDIALFKIAQSLARDNCSNFFPCN